MLKVFFSSVTILLVASVSATAEKQRRNVVSFKMPPPAISPDIAYESKLTVPETIMYRGFAAEQHTVTTTDGYILTLQRIAPRNASAPPVILWHGLLDSAFTWVANLRYQSLAFILADNGFDVWLGNSRGNVYSRAHVKYNPNRSRKFWEFSFDEMAKYDVPAAIDYVRNATGRDKVSWVGHSQGCLIAFAGFLDPQVASKIQVFVALAPAARVDHATSGLRYIAPFASTIEAAMYFFGSTGEFLPNTAFMKFISKALCGRDPVLCEDIIFILAGFNKTNINETRMPVYIAHTPAGTSTQDVVHFAQLINDKKFQYYDYGAKRNEEKYGQKTPPEYDLTKMKVPTAFFWSLADQLADPTDVRWLMSQTQNIIFNKTLETYSHLDFTWGFNAYQLIYPDVLTVLRQHQN